MPTNKPKFRSKKKLLNDYARYSAVGFQIAVVIFIGTWGGVKLDARLGLKIPVFTIVCSLLSVILSLYYFLRGFSNDK